MKFLSIFSLSLTLLSSSLVCCEKQNPHHSTKTLKVPHVAAAADSKGTKTTIAAQSPSSPKDDSNLTISKQAYALMCLNFIDSSSPKNEKFKICADKQHSSYFNVHFDSANNGEINGKKTFESFMSIPQVDSWLKEQQESLETKIKHLNAEKKLSPPLKIEDAHFEIHPKKNDDFKPLHSEKIIYVTKRNYLGIILVIFAVLLAALIVCFGLQQLGYCNLTGYLPNFLKFGQEVPAEKVIEEAAQNSSEPSIVMLWNSFKQWLFPAKN